LELAALIRPLPGYTRQAVPGGGDFWGGCDFRPQAGRRRRFVI
jgi:hypothetical protein